MSAVVVFESMFGNTEKIARAIAAGLRPAMDVTVTEVGDAPERLDAGVEPLEMTRPSTREDARRRVGDQVVSRGAGVREWLDALGSRPGTLTATFDTRAEQVRHLPGSAARGAGKVLRRHGFIMVGRPHSFYVLDVEGPLVDGEVERARRWGEELAHTYSESSSEGGRHDRAGRRTT